ncbi:M48 family metalloprotease [Luteipulveratus halotolerans]|uniref:M48 family metalloprotease n=1 Tax=Luteipulveratus halotolerans TaxID=1631356 RepID=UPI0018D05598|nr:M48 family metalloprotease [Luteipulveratus halotolerans]
MTDELEARTGLAMSDFRFYSVSHSIEPNAHSLGGHSIGLTGAFITLCEGDELTEDQVLAAITHEVGHHAGGALRFSAVLTWLALPYWTTAFLVREAVEWKPWLRLALPAALAAAGVVLLLHGSTLVRVAVILAVVALIAVPVLAGAWSQREEFSADEYAVDHDCGPGLRSYLRQFEHLDVAAHEVGDTAG